MRALGIRVPVVLGSMAIVLALLFGAQLLYNRQAVSQPLLRVYHEEPAVKSVNLQDAPQGLVIQVQLGRVDNLRETYLALQRSTTAVLGDQHFRLQIQDTRTPELLNDYYKLNAILMEGLATGRFVEMQSRAEALSESLDLDRVSVIPDQQNLYVSLYKGNNYLYEVINRQAPAAPNGASAP